MSHIKTVFSFGWKYLRRYWRRLAIGMLLGILFGATNASFVWATKTLVDRLKEEPAMHDTEFAAAAAVQPTAQAPPPAAPKPAHPTNTSGQPFKKRFQQHLKVALDSWLPRLGRPLDWRQVIGGILFLPLLVTVRSVTNYLSSYCIGWASERMINDMRLDVLDKLSSLSLDFFTRTSTGDLLTRINGDTAALLRCLRLGAADLVKETISLIGLLGAMLWLNWKLTLFAMTFVPFCLFPLLVLARKARQASRASRGGEILQTSQLVELVAGIRIIKAYLLEHAQIERYRKISRELVRQGMRGLRAKEMTTPLIEIISMLGLGVLVVFIFQTQTGIGVFVGFLMGMMAFFASVKKLAGVHILFEQAAPGVQRLVEILGMQPTVKEPAQPKTLTSFRTAIAFENVSFAYSKRPVIHQLTLRIPRGSKVGIAGPSGSGKSTLVNLLFRFYDPTAGAIKIDGTDLRDLSFRDLRQLMALVSQEVILFDQTVAENIACGKPDATRVEIEAAARAAYAHEFICQLGKGYDARVGERGVTLSGGQRQRLAIARAFIRNAPILVLDEATASLDSEAEAEVQRAIDHISENRTVICVAHRLSTLATCDLIIVMAEGRIVEQGGFTELLQAGGTFAAMARRQGIFAAKEALPGQRGA